MPRPRRADAALGVERRRGFLQGLGIDAHMILALSGLFGLTIAVNSTLGAVRAASGRVPVVGERLELLHSGWLIASEMLGTAFVLALLYVVYRICPARTLPRPASLAAAVTGTAWLGLFRWAFGWYAGLIRDVTFVYGAAGGVALFIVWLYCSALVLFVGAAVG
jgi:YihY family inner membrane protein